MPLQASLGAVFGELIELVGDVFVDRRPAAFGRNKIVAHHAGFERTLFAVQRDAPRIVRVHRRAETAMLADDGETVVLEHGSLRIGDIGFGRR
jgi:hypothetical protein